MDYKEQLSKLSWKIRRQEIIDRDNCMCHICHNSSYEKTTSKYSPVEFDNLWIQKVEELTPDEFNEGCEIQLSFLCKNFPDSHPLKRFYIGFYYREKAVNQISFYKKKNLTLYYSSDDGNSNGIALYDSERNEWLYVKDLHVHHKYYQLGKLAWEYPDDAYVTLCWDCHMKIHENSVIEVFDEFGKSIGLKRCCPRCGGAGYFPEYSHVEDGTCFQCRGNRFID